MPLAKPLFPIVFITSLLSFTAAADEIKLKNGDIITGTIIKKETETQSAVWANRYWQYIGVFKNRFTRACWQKFKRLNANQSRLQQSTSG